MAKRDKDSVSADAENIAVNESVEETLPTSSPTIESEAEALAFVKENFKVPEGVHAVFVTQDKQVFYAPHPASNHAVRKNLKLFSIKWD